MARLISCATGNFTSAATWALADSTSAAISEVGVSLPSVTPSWANSSAFTPGAITIDGIALKPSVRIGTTGTVSARLYNVTDTTDVVGTTVTIDVADLPSCAQTTSEGGWVLFKMSAPVLLVAAKSYRVELQTSNANQISFFRDATSNNFTRLLRTTTTQAPAAGDDLFIMGEHTGSGTGNDLTVTMDSTAATDYGSAATTQVAPALSISKRGTLTCGTTAATDYVLRVSGHCITYNGGTLNYGTTATPIPRDSTAIFELDCVSNLDFGWIFRNGSTFNGQGLSRTSGKDIIAARLTSTIVSTDTTLNVDTDTGWLDGDEVYIAKTTVELSQRAENRVLSGDAGASSMDVTVGVSNTHHGVAPYQAHVQLKTRNVVFRSVTTGTMTFARFENNSTTDLDWVQFKDVGNSSSQYGWHILTTTGSFNAQYCTLSENRLNALLIGSSSSNVTIQHCCFLNINNTGPNGQPAISFGSSLTNITFTDNYISGFGQAGAGSGQNSITIATVSIDFSRNVINSAGNGHALCFNNSGGVLGTFDDNELYGLNGSGDSESVAGAIQQLAPLNGGTINRLVSWHHNSSQAAGFAFTNVVSNLIFNDCRFYGSFSGVKFSSGGTAINCVFNNLQLNGDTVASSTNGFLITTGSALVGCRVNNSEIGIASGNYTDHTNDINVTGGYADVVFDNSTFGSATLVGGAANLSNTSVIAFNDFNATEKNHIWYDNYGVARSTGTGLTDTTVRTSGSLGLRLAPTSLTGFSWSFQVLARANTIVPVTGFLRKNTAFGTDVVTVDMYLPGSTTPDDTYTMSNTTEAWEPFTVSANYTGSVDLYATVTITAKTATSSAYLYVDDIYNGTNPITALDVWEDGQPSPIMFEQLGDAQATAGAVWGYSNTSAEFTTSGTAGNKLKSLKNASLILDGEIIV